MSARRGFLRRLASRAVTLGGLLGHFAHRRRFFLVPLVLVLLLPLLVLGLCLALLVQARELPRWLALFGGVYTLLCELRGVRIDVRGPGSQVLVSIL